MMRYNLSKTAAWIVALMSLMTVTTGCGGSKSNNVGGNPVSGPQAITTIQALPNGGVQITFTGSQAYYDYNPFNGMGVVFSAGPLPHSGQSYQINDQPYGSWLFLNGSRPNGSGTISITQNINQNGMFRLSGSAQLDPGTSLTVHLTQGTGTYHYNINSGILTLSQQSFQRLFGGQIRDVMGLAIDVGVSGTTLTAGGILIYTNNDAAGYHGMFLPFF